MLQINSIEFHGSGHGWANVLVDSGCAYFRWVVPCGDFVLGAVEGMESLHIKFFTLCICQAGGWKRCRETRQQRKLG